MKKLRYPLVYIEWHDAVGSEAWGSEESILIWGERYSDWKIFEVGWLLKKTKDYILIASRYNESSEKEAQWGQVQKIPRTWCKVITILSAEK